MTSKQSKLVPPLTQKQLEEALYNSDDDTFDLQDSSDDDDTFDLQDSSDGWVSSDEEECYEIEDHISVCSEGESEEEEPEISNVAFETMLSKDKQIEWSSEPPTQQGRFAAHNVLTMTPGLTKYTTSRVVQEEASTSTQSKKRGRCYMCKKTDNKCANLCLETQKDKVRGCSSTHSSVAIHGEDHGTIILGTALEFIVGLAKWSDEQVEIYCTGAIVRVFQDIKLVKWETAKITTPGKVSHIEVRDKFILLTPSYDFIDPEEYIEYKAGGNRKVTHLVFVEGTQAKSVLTALTERDDPYQINNSTPAIPYDNSTSSNTVKIYTSEKSACSLNRGYLILDVNRKVLCGIGLPLNDSNCYKEFLARHIKKIDMTGILQYMY
ncbi:hypothetical protein QE152_g36652 [Popillia japonica]|uniref:Uncharacterized protein n=1 Tax=Popillia japonica TaxID=7064 RepID=A0AAW1ID61_POPJA